MDDSCAVCAEPLEWVAYGSCGHREVCSTCVVRLRFVLEDRRCCICKNESPTVFITKALGDYTRVVTDFSAFPSGANEGQVGSYWYHDGSQAYFDDRDHYRMIKDMCRLSCSVCDKNDEEKGIESTKRKNRFKNLENLKGHLHHHHRVYMCNLCLEGRKVFISEQKLYTRPQLNQHIRTGDSEVDGSESERGGFMGHPMCEFCRNPFYGDNELYMHMSTEHYTCHICQRQHPGQYDYFRNYDDLEIHFRQEHFLCEDEACLAKKFIVFQSEAEMKRHNTIEHGGHMSRSQRNAALQIPTSFRYRKNNEQDQRRGRGRGRGFRPEPSNNDLSMVIQASLDTAIADGRVRESFSNSQTIIDPGQPNQPDRASGSQEPSIANSGSDTHLLEDSYFPPLSDRGPPEPPSRYAHALHQRTTTRLGEELFPPLPGAKENNKSKQVAESSNSTLASRLNRGKGKVKVINTPRPRPSESIDLAPSNSSSFPLLRPAQNQGPITSKASTSVRPRPSETIDVAPPNSLGFPQLRPAQNQGPITSKASTSARPRESETIDLAPSNPSGFPQLRPAQNQGPITSKASMSMRPRPSETINLSPSNASSFPELRPAQNQGPITSKASTSVRQNGFLSPNPLNSSWSAVGVNRMRHSSSAPNLGDAPKQVGKQVMPPEEDEHTANKSLIEQIRIGLGNDEERYAAFKSISAEYRKGQINTWEYISYVEQFGLMHLVPELARLCPDPSKKQELFDAYDANIQGLQENGDIDAGSSKEAKNLKKKGKGKGKSTDGGSDVIKKDELADSFLDAVQKLQLKMKYQEEEEVEVLSKDGYRRSNPNSNSVRCSSVNLANSSSSSREQIMESASSRQNPSGGGGKSSKQRKKTSKFNRVRLGDGAAAADACANSSPERTEDESRDREADGLLVRGVWKNDGAKKLFKK